MVTSIWSVLVLAALLSPSRTLGAFDGMPLNQAPETILIGLVVPALWWLDRRVLQGWWPRVAIVCLLIVKIGSVLLQQEGLCAKFSTTSPLATTIQTIPIDEPAGFLRSWDVRADWTSTAPRCTAIIDRAYSSATEFPAWFVNILDAARPGRQDLAVDLTGQVDVHEAGTLSLVIGEDMTVAGHVGAQPVSAAAGGSMEVALAKGVHPIELRGTLTGSRWALTPRWQGEDAWRTLRFTIATPKAIDVVAPAVSAITTALTLAIVSLWIMSAVRTIRPSRAIFLWMTGATLALVYIGSEPRIERVAGLLLIAAALVPIGVRHRNLRGAFLLIGVPWLAFFAAHGFSQIGRFTAYSADDWLTYQVAGYRIFMNGFWLEAGSLTFDYQPLYRWISGALHLVFGDSSVGETYLDAAGLLAGALLAFQLTKYVAGYRAGLLAAAGTLATFTLGTIWYFVGRGLSEIAAAGFAFLAMSFLLRARLGRSRSALSAGAFAVLMFYTRLNHLLFAAFLPVLVLPVRLPCIAKSISRALGRVRVRVVALYVGVVAAGVALFATRTWWFTGVFSLFFGTSLKNNDTGLRLSTLGTADVWVNVGHSLSALLWMNEPPHFDPRAAFVVCGVVAALLAVFHVPLFVQVPASLAVLTLGALASSLFVHTHNYPGRMSVHVVPLASAVTVLTGSAIRAAILTRLRRSAGPQ